MEVFLQEKLQWPKKLYGFAPILSLAVGLGAEYTDFPKFLPNCQAVSLRLTRCGRHTGTCPTKVEALWKWSGPCKWYSSSNARSVNFIIRKALTHC